MDETPVIRAALYTRVSSRTQVVEGTSLDSQEERLRAYCLGKGWEVHELYVDAAESGAKSSRPELNRLMADAEAGLFERVVVLKLDRWSRSLAHLETSLEELTEWGVSLASVTEDVDFSTVNGELFMGMIGTIAKIERRTIKERTLSGRRYRAESGAWPGGNMPFGFRLADHPEGRKGRGRVVVHEPDEVATVLRIVQLLLDHDRTTGQIAATLNAEGRPTKRDGRWTHQKVARLLASDALIGNYIFARSMPRNETGINDQPRNPQRDRRRFDKVVKRVGGQDVVLRRERKKNGNGDPIPIPLPPILNEQTFAQVQAKLGSTAHGRRDLPDRFYSLSGFLYFPCDQDPVGTRAHGLWRDKGGPQGTRRMVCANSKTSASHPERCGCPALLEQPLADAVWRSVVELIADPDYLANLARERLAQLDDEPEDVAGLEVLIERQEAKMTAELVKFVSAGLDSVVIERVRDTMQSDLQTLRERREGLLNAEASRRASSAATGRLETLATSGRDRLLALDDRTRSKVYALLDLEVRIIDFGQPNGKLTERRPPVFEIAGRLSHSMVETLLLSPVGMGNLAGDRTR